MLVKKPQRRSNGRNHPLGPRTRGGQEQGDPGQIRSRPNQTRTPNGEPADKENVPNQAQNHPNPRLESGHNQGSRFRALAEIDLNRDTEIENDGGGAEKESEPMIAIIQNQPNWRNAATRERDDSLLGRGPSEDVENIPPRANLGLDGQQVNIPNGGTRRSIRPNLSASSPTRPLSALNRAVVVDLSPDSAPPLTSDGPPRGVQNSAQCAFDSGDPRSAISDARPGVIVQVGSEHGQSLDSGTCSSGDSGPMNMES